MYRSSAFGDNGALESNREERGDDTYQLEEGREGGHKWHPPEKEKEKK